MNLATTVGMSATRSSFREGSISNKLGEGGRSSSSLLALRLARTASEGERDASSSSSGIGGTMFGLRKGMDMLDAIGEASKSRLKATGEASTEPSGERAGVGAGVGWPPDNTISATPQSSDPASLQLLLLLLPLPQRAAAPSAATAAAAAATVAPALALAAASPPLPP